MEVTVSKRITRLPALAGLLSILVMATGCANNQTPTNAPTGQVLGSITYAGPPAQYKIYYAPIDKSAGVSRSTDFISVTTNGKDKGDSKLDLGDQFFAIDLAPGKYKFTSWEVSNGPTTVRPEETFFVSFEVLPTGTVYVGNFNFEIPAGLDLEQGGVHVTYSDRLSQDVGKFSDRYSSVEMASISRSLDEEFSLEWAAGTGESDMSLSLIIFSSF